MTKPVYKAVFELDDNGAWFVRAPDVPGAHSHGRSLTRARANLREALALVLEVGEDDFDLEEVLALPANVRRCLERARGARAKAAVAQQAARAATEEAVRVLSGEPLSLSARDIAELVGVSFQRVHQLRTQH